MVTALTYRIERRDYSQGRSFIAQRPQRGLLRRASVEPDKHISMHPALRVSIMASGKLAALSRAGEARFTGRCCPSRRTSETLRVHDDHDTEYRKAYYGWALRRVEGSSFLPDISEITFQMSPGTNRARFAIEDGPASRALGCPVSSRTAASHRSRVHSGRSRRRR